MNVLKMAWRNVWRNYRRSAITIAAMSLALVVELLYSGLVTGMTYGMEDDVTEYDIGDVQVFSEGYLTKPSLYDAIKNPNAIVAALQAKGYRATPRLYSGGLAASGESSTGAAFLGVDPIGDAKTMALAGALAEGQWLSDDDPQGVVIGRGMARILDAKVGSEIVVLSSGADGSMANGLFIVRGVLMSVASGTDRATILMTEGAFRDLMVFPEGAHKIIVRRPKDVPLAQAKGVVEATVAAVGQGSVDGGALGVKTWKELSAYMAQMLDSVAGMIFIVYFIVYIAVAILILNAMLMAVFERIREFGVLKAIGFSPWQVLTMMVAEGMLQAVVATVIGLVVAAPGMWYLATVGVNVGVLGGVQMVGMTMPAIWKGHYALKTAVVPVIMLFFIVFAAVIYPAIKAAWISPVEAMHHQ